MDHEHDKKTSAYLTHELRAPLTSIACAIELLRDELATGSPEESRKLLDVALCNCRRLDRLIDDIMDMSRIQAGNMKIESVPCDPVRLAHDTAALLEPWARRKGISVSVDAEPNCPPISADPRRVVQALTNLVSNALKFTPPGGAVVITAAAGRRERAGYAVLSVRDNGCGIAAQEMSAIFRYFVRAGGAGNREQGTGLGLPLARSLVELQGGELWVESELGKGSAFHIALPLCMPTLDRGADPSQGAPFPGVSPKLCPNAM